MRPAEKIKNLFLKSNVKVDSKLDEKIMNDALMAFEKSKKTKPANPKPNIWKIVARSKITKAAAAIAIILTINFVLSRNILKNNTDVCQILTVSNSPARMLSLGSTTIAYRHGGMDAVEKQIEIAFRMLGPRTTSIAYEDLH